MSGQHGRHGANGSIGMPGIGGSSVELLFSSPSTTGAKQIANSYTLTTANTML